MALSTLGMLENRFSADVVKQWADDDRDGTADAAVVNAALEAASSDVEAMLLAGYPDVIPFDVTNIPAVIVGIVTDLAGYALASRRQKAAEQYEKIFTQALDRLKLLLQPKACLRFPDNTVIYLEMDAQADTSGAVWSSTEETEPIFTETAFQHY
jgi:phage gp36-like protein